MRQQCYKAFLADVEPKAMEILKKFHMARALTAGSKGQSYGERKAEFRKLTTKLTDLVSATLSDLHCLSFTTCSRWTHMKLCMVSVESSPSLGVFRIQTAGWGRCMRPKMPRRCVAWTSGLLCVCLRSYSVVLRSSVSCKTRHRNDTSQSSYLVCTYSLFMFSSLTTPGTVISTQGISWP